MCHTFRYLVILPDCINMFNDLAFSCVTTGRALLLKAAKHTSLPNDPVQNAYALGVDIQKVSKFLKETEHICIKEKKSRKAGVMEGIEPLTWSEKENFPILKCEDLEKLFKPLIKHLDAFPNVNYDPEVASPFDKNVYLCRKTKENVNRYAVDKQALPVSKKGGYCEACEYWYKCTLRQHLNSEKHLKFTRDSTNYEALDKIMRKLPSLETFAKKFNICENMLLDSNENKNSSSAGSLSAQEDETLQRNKELEETNDATVSGKIGQNENSMDNTLTFSKCVEPNLCENAGQFVEDEKKKDILNHLNPNDAFQERNTEHSNKPLSDFHFSPIHSPNHVPENLSFTDLANQWMADIKSTVKNGKECNSEMHMPNEIQGSPTGKCGNTEGSSSQMLSQISNPASCVDNTEDKPVPAHSNNIAAPCPRKEAVLRDVNEAPNIEQTHRPTINVLENVLKPLTNHFGTSSSNTPQPAVVPKAPVNRRLTYSPSNDKTTLQENQENKENQPATANRFLPEPVQQPLKIKINLNGLKVNPEVKVVKSHRKRSKRSASNVYCAVQQSDMKLKLCKVKVTPIQQNHDLHHFWKVRKSGGCRLVFSAEKRKASEDVDNTVSKRKRLDVQ